MLAQCGASVADAAGFREPRGGSSLPNRPASRMLGFHHYAVRGDLGVGQHGGPCQHRRAGKPSRVSRSSHSSAGRVSNASWIRAETFVDVALAQRGGLEPRVVQPFRFVECPGKGEPFAVGLDRGADGVVGGLVDQVDEAGGFLLGDGLADKGLAAHVGGPKESDHRIQHRQPNMLPLACSLPRSNAAVMACAAVMRSACRAGWCAPGGAVRCRLPPGSWRGRKPPGSGDHKPASGRKARSCQSR